MEATEIILNELDKINNEISPIKNKMCELFTLMLDIRKTQLKQCSKKDPGFLDCNTFPDDELLDKLEKQELQNAISTMIADEKKYNCIYPQT
jgi:hypothetical protein